MKFEFIHEINNVTKIRPSEMRDYMFHCTDLKTEINGQDIWLQNGQETYGNDVQTPKERVFNFNEEGIDFPLNGIMREANVRESIRDLDELPSSFTWPNGCVQSLSDVIKTLVMIREESTKYYDSLKISDDPEDYYFNGFDLAPAWYPKEKNGNYEQCEHSGTWTEAE